MAQIFCERIVQIARAGCGVADNTESVAFGLGHCGYVLDPSCVGTHGLSPTI